LRAKAAPRRKATSDAHRAEAPPMTREAKSQNTPPAHRNFLPEFRVRL
jgi:hypothetical protein